MSSSFTSPVSVGASKFWLTTGGTAIGVSAGDSGTATTTFSGFFAAVGYSTFGGSGGEDGAGGGEVRIPLLSAFFDLTAVKSLVLVACDFEGALYAKYDSLVCSGFDAFREGGGGGGLGGSRTTDTGGTLSWIQGSLFQSRNDFTIFAAPVKTALNTFGSLVSPPAKKGMETDE